jgi:3-oxoacyl-[acyl-carrier protein] reductase
MDLGIAGRRLGRACAYSLAENGVHVTIAARGRDALEATADEIRRATGVEVETVVADITTQEGRTAALEVCPEPDILVNNAGGPPPGDFREWSRDAWIAALDANMLTPIELIKSTVDGMILRRFGRIVNITSSAVKAPIEALGLSNGARSGLTGFVAGLARKTVRHNVTINNLLPGPFETDRLRAVTPADQWEQRRDAHPAGRFGQPEEFGEACAFLCSAQAGYITGQNLLLDGGAYPGVF